VLRLPTRHPRTALSAAASAPGGHLDIGVRPTGADAATI